MALIIDKTEFIFEDGNTYYFDIHDNNAYSSSYDLFIYKKEEVKKITKGLFKEVITFEYKYDKVVNDSCRISNTLDTVEIKSVIKRKLDSIKTYDLKGWDGFVGDVDECKKKMLNRDSKLDSLLK